MTARSRLIVGLLLLVLALAIGIAFDHARPARCQALLTAARTVGDSTRASRGLWGCDLPGGPR